MPLSFASQGSPFQPGHDWARAGLPLMPSLGIALHVTRRGLSLRCHLLQFHPRDAQSSSSVLPHPVMSSSPSSTLPPGVVAPSPTEPSTLPPGVAPSPSPVIPPAGIASSDSANTLSGNALSSTSTPNQSSLSSAITPLPLVVSTNPPSSSPSSPQTSATSVSTTTSQDSASSSSAHTSPTNSSNSSPHQLANGAVAGIVIAVALGLSLLTFLATYFLMRRRQQSKGRRRDRSSRDSGELEMKPPRQRSKKPFATEASGVSDTYENYLPQSADDRTIHQKTKVVLDQIELHVENFYRNSSSSAPRPDNAQLAVFDSPYLPASLASLLPRSKKKTNIIKHALAQSVTSSISPSASPARSLLPTEYGLLPNTVASAMSTVSTKAGEYRFIKSKFLHFWTVANLAKGLAKSCLDGV